MLYLGNTALEAEDIAITEEINGEYALDFFLPYNAATIPEVGNVIEEDYYAGQQYTVEKVEKTLSETPGYKISCRHVYFTAERVFIAEFPHQNGETAADIFEDIWTGVPGFAVLNASEITALGMTPVVTLTDFDDRGKTNPIDLTEELIKVVGQGEVYINNKTVALVETVGARYNRLVIDVHTNADSVSVAKDVSGLTTRLYAFGKNEMDLTSTLGVAYIDSPNISQYGVIERYMDFPEISDSTMLLARAQWQFDRNNQSRIDEPHISISCKFTDVSQIDVNTNIPYLGQAVTVGGYTNKRLIKITRRPLEPYNTDITIGQIKKDLFYFFKRFNNTAADVESGNINVTNNPHTVTQITEITKQEVVAADMIEATAAFIDDLQIERLETNLKNYICLPNITIVNDVPQWNDDPHTWHAKQGYSNSNVRGYIKLFEMQQQFIEARLVTPADSSAIVAAELEAVQISGRQLYFTSISGSSAFEYLTFTAPTAKYPGMSTEIAAMYVVYKRKSSAEYVKMQQVFTWNAADDTYYVDTVYGTGDGQGRGKYKFAKNADSGKLVYTSRTTGAEIGIKLDDTGVYVTQDGTNWTLIGDDGGAGGADSSIGAVKIVDGAITAADIEDGYNVYIAYDPAATPYIESSDVNILQVTSDSAGHGIFVKREKPITPVEISPETLYLASNESDTTYPGFYCYPEGGDEVVFSLETDIAGITLTQSNGNEMYLTIPAGITTSGTVTIKARGVNDTSIFGEMTIPFINAKPVVVGLSNIIVTYRSDPYEFDGQTRTQNSYQATCEVQCDLLPYNDYLDIYSDARDDVNVTSHTNWVITGTTATCTVEFYCGSFGSYYRAFPFVAANSYQSSDVKIVENLPD